MVLATGCPAQRCTSSGTSAIADVGCVATFAHARWGQVTAGVSAGWRGWLDVTLPSFCVSGDVETRGETAGGCPNGKIESGQVWVMGATGLGHTEVLEHVGLHLQGPWGCIGHAPTGEGRHRSKAAQWQRCQVAGQCLAGV